MQGESVERDLLTAAKAIERQLITPEELARATARWRKVGSGSLLAFLEELPDMDEMRREELRRLFADYHDSLVGEIAESIEDSLFGKLNSALANVGDDDLNASVANWQETVSARASEYVAEDDRFHIIAAHAKGGLGEVLLAEDRQLRRNVALKRIREKWSANEHARVRFQQEAEITGRLEHPGVVPVYALGRRKDGQIYYAMRFIRGESLEAATARFHENVAAHPDAFLSSDFRDLMRRFIDVCNTISYAHSRGIIHRDLKPANIMLGRYGETLVVDWGLAKQVGVDDESSRVALESLIVADAASGSAPTQFGSALGTPQYMSPEQAAGRLDRMGPTTDVFGLGATLYHVLTNQPPQTQDSVERILERVEHGEYRRASVVNERVPRALEAISAKAMATRSSERYADPRKLSADVEKWLADERVSVFEDPLKVRASRWVRKNQTLAAMTALAMVLLIVASVVGSFVRTRFERQKFEFEQAEIERRERANAQAQVRYARLQASLRSTNEIVRTQLAAGQFDLAVSVLTRDIERLKGETEARDERAVLQQRSDSLKRIAEFYRLSSAAQEANFLAQDEDEIIACFRGLSQLGVWEHADWWNFLPDGDLNPEQRHQLRETVYRCLVLVASTYTKLTGTRTLKSVGSKMPENLSEKLSAIFSPDGKEEARATLAICRLANRYRYAECLEWYNGVAGLRLLKSMMVPARKLDEPRSPVDAYEIAVLLLTRALTEDFPFTGYQGVSDDLLNARELLSRAAQMSPDHYFTNLVLAQSEFLLGERAAEQGDPEAWRYYELSQHAFGRCIAINPQLPFAYGDVSSVCLREKEVIHRSQSLTEEDIKRYEATLLTRCMDFALHAVERDPQASWVYWHYGHALAAVDQIDDAMEAYRKAVTMSFRFSEDSNDIMIDVDKIRGRSRVISESQKQIDGGDNRSIFHAVIAASHLDTRDFDAAAPYAERARNLQPVDALAWSTSGIIALHDDDPALSLQYFRRASSTDPNSFWAALGEGLSLEKLERFDDALTAFGIAKNLAVEEHQQADACLGECRCLIKLRRGSEAATALKAARGIYPACSIVEIEETAVEFPDAAIQAALTKVRHLSTADIVNNTKIVDTRAVYVHNHDFELPSVRSWSNPGAPAWHVTGAGVSMAVIERDGNNHVLHVTTDAAGSEIRATTRQTITVDHDSDYELFVRARWEHSENGSLEIYVTEDGGQPAEPVVVVPAGKSEWRTLRGTFRSPRLRRNKGLMPMTLWIVSKARADLWIDDLEISKPLSP